MNLLQILAAELRKRFGRRIGPGGRSRVRRVVARCHDPRLVEFGECLVVTLSTTRPYRDHPACPVCGRGGMCRAVLRMAARGDRLQVVPPSPVLRGCRMRAACLVARVEAPLPWVVGVTQEAEGVLLWRLTTTPHWHG